MKKGNGPVFDGKARRMIEDMIATEKRQIEERRLQEECACKDGMFPRVDRRHLLFAAGSSAGTLALAALTRRTAAEGLKAPPGAQAGLSNYTLPPATTLGGVKQGAGVSIASASGSLQQTTGSMTAGSATLTLASALDFANGQGLRVTGAGPAFSLNAPTSLAASVVGAGGSAVYQYTVAPVDVNNGVGAALTAVTLTGASSTLSISKYNHVTWTAPSSGTAPTGYAVYGTRAGSMALIGIVNGTTFKDFGNACPTNFDWLPATPPASARNGFLITKILSGGGTTTLTLNDAASSTVRGGTVVHDDTAALNAALSSMTNGGILQLPAGDYLLSGDLRVANRNIAIEGFKAASLHLGSMWYSALVPANAVRSYINLIPSSIVTGYEHTRMSNVKISGLNFYGLNTFQDWGNACPPNALSTLNCDNVTIEGCRFYNFPSETIWPSAYTHTDTATSWKVINNYFNNCGLPEVKAGGPGCALQCNFNDSIVSGNTLVNCGIGIGVSFAQRITVVGNEVNGFALAGISAGGDGNQYDCVISGNTIIGVNLGISYIAVAGIQIDSDQHNISVTGNTVRMATGSNSIKQSYGINCAGASDNILIANNAITLDMASLTSVSIIGINLNSGSNASVNGNIITCLNEANTYHAGILCLMYAGQSASIYASNNVVSGINGSYTGYAYDIGYSSGAIVAVCTNNICTNSGASSRYGNNHFIGSVPVSVPVNYINFGASTDSYTTVPTRGVATSVADGGTISHGLPVAPTIVTATGSVAGNVVTVTAITSTTFTVAIKTGSGSAGTAQNIYWSAEYLP